ncbi:MAG: AAA family ATPase [Opitutales bacterium]
MELIFIHGPAAAGKYTIGSLLSERMGIPLFHNHLVVDVAKSLFEFGEPGFIAIRDKMWRASFEEAAKAKKSFIFTFNPEKTVDPQLIWDITDIYREHGGRVHYVELVCSDAAILKRIGDESRKAFGKLTDQDIFQKFKDAGGFEFPEFPEPLVRVDTEMLFPDEAVETVLKALGDC